MALGTRTNSDRPCRWLLRSLLLVGLAGCPPVFDRGDTVLTLPDPADADADAGVSGGSCTVTVDRDGDDVVAYDTSDCPDVPDDRRIRRNEDCDDTDADLQVIRFVDRDGDGYGAGDGVCVGTDDDAFNGVDLSINYSDCDDGDPAIVPRWPAEVSDADLELPLDGIDSNCDGLDFPRVDIELGAEDPRLLIPAAVRCSGRGLSIVAVSPIWNQCGGGFAVYVGNRGNVAVSNATLRVSRAIAVPGEVGAFKAVGQAERYAVPEVAAGKVSKLGPYSEGVHWIELNDPDPPGRCADFGVSGAVHAPRVECN